MTVASPVSQLDPRAAGARRFVDKICIVTGAGQGIGKAVAKRLAAEGGTVVVAERAKAAAVETCRELEGAGVSALACIADLSRLGDAKRLVEETVQTFNRVDVLINVVGGTIWWQPFHLYTEEQIQLEMERSLLTTLWGCHAVLPTMIAQRAGTIVNVSSNVTKGSLYRTPYAVSKGGVNALTRTLAAEYGRYGIRINATAPGRTEVPDRVTPRMMMSSGALAQPVENQDRFFEETRAHRPRALGRSSTPDEQAAAIAFLASHDASYITGEIITCDGGA
jgi:NAD(P)-dependent dehydrogenase (short-subunit alcohol dehydrogenase family)